MWPGLVPNMRTSSWVKVSLKKTQTKTYQTTNKPSKKQNNTVSTVDFPYLSSQLSPSNKNTKQKYVPGTFAKYVMQGQQWDSIDILDMKPV